MNTRPGNLTYIPFYFFTLLLVTVPLAITMYFENPVDLVKMGAFVILGSLFVIFSLVISLEENLKSGNKFTLYTNRLIDIPVLFFAAAAILSTIFSISPRISFFGQYQRQIGLNTFLYLAVIYFLLSGILQDKRRFVTLFLTAELTAIAVSVYSILQISGLDPFGMQSPALDRPVSTLGNAVFLGGFLVLIFPFSALNTSCKNNKFIRIIFPAVILAGIVLSGTRSAYIAVAAEIVVMAVFIFFDKNRPGNLKEYLKSNKTFKNVLYIAGAALMILVLYMLIFPQSFLTGRVISILSFSDNPRLLLWQESFNIFYKYPVFGTGIALFSSAFEEFYSGRLRILERTGYFDHPHNNFLYMLYSMGVIGLLAYLSIFIQAIRCCLKNIFSDNAAEEKITFTAFLVFITGYFVYGLTNFDDISILLYFFVFLAALKAADKSRTKEISLSSKLIAAAAIPVILVCTYNIYSRINDMKADRFFKTGNTLIKEGKFAEAVYNMNTAIALNDYYTDYKYSLAYTVYRQVFSSESMPKETKMNLLNQAAKQVEGIINNHYFNNECYGLLSLIYYEMEREQEARSLELKVLEKDPVNITYRINLARYYMKKGDLVKADELMNTVMQLRPKSLDAYLTAAYLNYKKGNLESARMYCEQILAAEPGNQFALKLLNDINSEKKH
ncbi:MAG TPA: O-antigen ligase family protein [Ignavibacteria bacterium]|nr:O-antigen ligase family protein [Ignavibacteria bacterium]